MAVKVKTLIEELKDDVRWQRTPLLLKDADYGKMINRGYWTLMVDTARHNLYSPIEDYDGGEVEIESDEAKYVLLVAKIEFFKRVQGDVNNIVSYTTDAMSVTNADKPYVHLQDTINELEKERRKLFYKLVRFVQ